MITVKWRTKPEWTDRFMELVGPFTKATRAEPGNLWFEWSKSIEADNEFVLIEAFTDDGAAPHVNSEHFKQAMKDLPQALVSTPQILSRQVEGDGWEQMGEMSV